MGVTSMLDSLEFSVVSGDIVGGDTPLVSSELGGMGFVIKTAVDDRLGKLKKIMNGRESECSWRWFGLAWKSHFSKQRQLWSLN